MTIAICPLMHNAIADSFYNSIVSKSSKYYYFIGKTTPYPKINGIEQLENPIADYGYELDVRRNIISLQEITSNNVCYVIPRIDWVNGTVYDCYDDSYSTTNFSNSGSSSLDGALYYVLTDEYYVYICLDNNYGSLSTEQPTGYSHKPFVTSDGYKWKFVMLVADGIRNKFLTDKYMPVVTAVNSIFYDNGSIDSITIDNGGSGYPSNSDAKITVNSLTTSADDLIVGTTYAINTLGTTNFMHLGAAKNVVGEIFTANSNLTYYWDNRYSDPSYCSQDYLAKLELEYYCDQTYWDPFFVSSDYAIKGSHREFYWNTVYCDPNYVTSWLELPIDIGTVIGTGAILEPCISTVDGSISRVNVISGGSGYPSFSSLTVTGTGSGKYAPNLAALLWPIIVADVIEFVAVVDPGKGYNQNNTELVINSISGSGAVCSAVVERGQIVDVIIDNPGTGYTDALLKAYGNNATDAQAVFTVNTSGGRLDTIQANVELLAVDGAIDYIKVTNQGSGYQSASIEIFGDGVGATATAVLKQGNLVGITITSRGSGYTYATVNILGVSGLTSINHASARAIMSPKYGHGFDAIRDLGAKTLMLYSTLMEDNSSRFLITNGNRQFGILKNPNKYNSMLYSYSSVGTACFTVFGTSNNGSIVSGMKLYDINDKSYIVISTSETSILIQSIDNGIPVIGGVLTIGLITYTITSVINPNIDKYSGEMIYVDNRLPFVQSREQALTFQTALQF